jgi:hypothetical protein
MAHGYFPVWFTACNAFAEIAWRDDIYARCPRSRRWSIASQAFLVILVCKGVLDRIKLAVVWIARAVLGADRYRAFREHVRAINM